MFCLTWCQIVTIKVSQCERLRDKEIIEFSKVHIDITKILPKYSCEKEPNREYLCKNDNSLLLQESNAFIEAKIDIKMQELIKSQSISVLARH